VVVGSTRLHRASPAADIFGSVASLLAGGERLPTDQLPGAAKMHNVEHKKGCGPACVQRVAGNHRKLAVQGLFKQQQRLHCLWICCLISSCAEYWDKLSGLPLHSCYPDRNPVTGKHLYSDEDKLHKLKT